MKLYTLSVHAVALVAVTACVEPRTSPTTDASGELHRDEDPPSRMDTDASEDGAAPPYASPPPPGSEKTESLDAGSSHDAGTTDDASENQGPAPKACSLTDSAPIVTTHAGQIISHLRITARGAPAIVVKHAGVTVRDVAITHRGAAGILVVGANDVAIANVSIENLDAPASGPNSSSRLNNIECQHAKGLTVTNARLTRGSAGVYLIHCANSRLTSIAGYDFRGPYPRGQLVQWNASHAGLLEHFSVVNPSGSWPEDVINVYRSYDVTIRDGLVDGNNSPAGVGVIFDGGDSTGLVEDVDAVRQANGCFSGYAGGEDVTFRGTRCVSNICTDQGRGLPHSNALAWAGNPKRTMQRIESSSYDLLCNPNNVSWPSAAFEERDLSHVSPIVLRKPVDVLLCWETGP